MCHASPCQRKPKGAVGTYQPHPEPDEQSRADKREVSDIGLSPKLIDAFEQT